MKILHTSDWHLGRLLFGRKRYAESERMLDWMIETIEENDVDAVLIAGDIFDNVTPSHRALELYYDFLHRASDGGRRPIVVIAGNHDSPALLDGPRDLLRNSNVHVLGTPSTDPKDDVVVLCDPTGTPRLIVAAAPHLRDRDLRTAESGETIDDKERKLQEGIRTHFANLALAAVDVHATVGADEAVDGPLPIVAMGHLFTAGGKGSEGDGVRPLYVGSLGHVGADVFSPDFDYVALGHLHVPQRVGKNDTRRYCGSPLPMNFGESEQEKTVLLVDLLQGGETPDVVAVPIPRFQRLLSIRGDWSKIESEINLATKEDVPTWAEILYEGDEVIADLQEKVRELTDDTSLEPLRIRSVRGVGVAMTPSAPEETLGDLDEEEVFTRCLDANETPDSQRDELLQTFREAVHSLQSEDDGA